MIRFFKELYLTGFTLGFRARMPEKFGGGWGPVIDAGKGVAVLSLIILINLTNIRGWIEIYIGTRFSFDSSRWAQWAIALIFFYANYYVLVTRGRGIKFEREEFKNLKISRKVLLIMSFTALLLATIVFSIYSVSTYQRFFHL
ncbi:MAG: hypothetical protein WBN75_19845 [Verrucomicrobiia bacterium]